MEQAKQFVEKHMNAKMDTYTLAVVANFAADYGKDRRREFTRQAIQLLLDARTEKGELVWWSAEDTGVYATGKAPLWRPRDWRYKRCSSRVRIQARHAKP